jgi:hypothetical protein
MPEHKRKRMTETVFGAETRTPAPALSRIPYVPYVSIQVLHDRNASVVNAQLAKGTGLEPPEYAYKASGSAKREHGDVHDETTAEMLALARALQDLSRQLLRDARKRVRASAEAQAAERERTAAKRMKAACPVPRRTLEEWEEIQERAVRAQRKTAEYYAEQERQRVANAGLAGSLGLDLEPDAPTGRKLSSVANTEQLPPQTRKRR